MFTRPNAAWFYRDGVPEGAPLALRFLGTAGFVLEFEGHTLAIDPFVSRPGLLRTACCRLRPDAARVRELLPQADDVLVGHAHHDHVMDAPQVCAATGARLVGSADVLRVGRAAGLPESQLQLAVPRRAIQSGPCVVTPLSSRHGRVYGRVPLPGSVADSFRWPGRVWHFRHGDVLTWHVRCGTWEVVHIDSADYDEAALADMRADVLCLCAIGWVHRPDYVASLVRLLRPRWIVPCHWDWFFGAYRQRARQLPFCRLGAFLEAIEACGVERVLLEPLASWGPPPGG